MRAKKTPAHPEVKPLTGCATTGCRSLRFDFDDYCCRCREERDKRFPADMVGRMPVDPLSVYQREQAAAYSDKQSALAWEELNGIDPLELPSKLETLTYEEYEDDDTSIDSIE